jgi:hypothetical protein
MELLYFFPEVAPLEVKLRHVGFCRACLDFAAAFKPTEAGCPARTATIALRQRKIFLREVEPGIWMALVVLAAKVEARLPTDGSELGDSLQTPLSRKYEPALAAGGVDPTDGLVLTESALSASARASATDVGADFLHTLSDSGAQSLLDSIYQQWCFLAGSIWGALGGEHGRGLIDAVAALMRERRKLRSKLFRNDGTARDAGEGSASLKAASPRHQQLLDCESSIERLTRVWGLWAVRRRMRQALTWGLGHIDFARWSPMDGMEGFVPGPVDPSVVSKLRSAVEAIRSSHRAIHNVIVLWDGVAVAGTRSRLASRCISFVRRICWQLLHKLPVRLRGYSAAESHRHSKAFWSTSSHIVYDQLFHSSSSGAPPREDGDSKPSEAPSSPKLSVLTESEVGPSLKKERSYSPTGADPWSTRVLTREHSVPPDAEQPLGGTPLAFFQDPRAAGVSGALTTEAAASLECDRGFVGLPAGTPLPSSPPLSVAYLESLGPLEEAARRELTVVKAAAAIDSSDGPVASSASVRADALGPPLPLLGLAAGHWSDALALQSRGESAAFVSRSPRLLALPVCDDSDTHGVASRRLMWMQFSRLSVLLVVDAAVADSPWVMPASLPSDPASLPSVEPDLLSLCLAAATAAHDAFAAVAPSLATSLRASHQRTLSDAFVQQHLDSRACGRFGSLAVGDPGASVSRVAGSSTDATRASLPLHTSLMLSRSLERMGSPDRPPLSRSELPVMAAESDSTEDVAASLAAHPDSSHTPLSQMALERARNEVVRAREMHKDCADTASEMIASLKGRSDGAVQEAAEEVLRSGERRLGWAVQAMKWAPVLGAHWDVVGGGNVGVSSVDVPANYDSPETMAAAAARVKAEAVNSFSVPRPLDSVTAAAEPVTPSLKERVEVTRRNGATITRREGFRQVSVVHMSVTPSMDKVGGRARELLSVKYRHVFV